MDANFRKIGLGLFFVFLVLLSGCSMQTTNSINDIWTNVLHIGGLGFLGGSDGPVVGFMRIMVFILVFSLIYGGLRLVLGGLGSNIPIVIAAVISIISVIFIPGPVLMAIGGAYGTVVAFVLIGSVVFAGGLMLYIIPTTNRGWRLVRFIILCLLLFILMNVRDHAKILLTTGVGLAAPFFI